jgi:hypothetical protein
MEQLARLVNADERLVWRGRYVHTTFLLEVGDEAWLIHIDAGRVAAVTRGPFVMPTWAFALRASREDWALFWHEAPPPGSHDLFALVKRRALRIEGDLHPFMSNLLYFKAVLAMMRGPGGGGLKPAFAALQGQEPS